MMGRMPRTLQMRKKPSAKTRLERRRFFQTGAKVIPALAVLGLAFVVPAHAANCSAGCVGDCTGTCGTKCADNCTSSCETNCQGTCLGGCAGSSKNT